MKGEDKTILFRDKPKIYVGIENRGGIGDVVIDTLFIKELRKALPPHVVLDYYSKPYHIIGETPFLDHCYTAGKRIEQSYDLYLDMRRIPLVKQFNRSRLKKELPLLFQIACDFQELLEKQFEGCRQDSLFIHYCQLLGKNRLEEFNAFNRFPFDRNARRFMYIKPETLEILSRYRLTGKSYITVNRDVDSEETAGHPKLWPLIYYQELINQIRKAKPELLIVRIGAVTHLGELDEVDIDLSGKTTLEEAKAILKHSLLHIDGEGGLVHLKNFLNGRSAVLFGPTSVEYYGYEQNRNLSACSCALSCEWVTNDWSKRCLRGFSLAPCMEQLKPLTVFEQIIDMLEPPARSYILTEVISKNVFFRQKLSQTHAGNLAVWGRSGEAVAKAAAQKMDGVYLFDSDLSLDGHICGYTAKALQEGFRAEYGCLFNLPARDGEFQIVYSQEELPEGTMYFAVLELLRIVSGEGILCITVPKAGQEEFKETLSRLDIKITDSILIQGHLAVINVN